MKNRLLVVLGLLLLIGIGATCLATRDRATATPAPEPRGFSIVCVPMNEPVPTRHLALVVDPSGDLRLPGSNEPAEDALQRAFRPGREADRITYIKLTVQDEDKTMLDTLSKALVRLRDSAAPEVFTVIAVHLEGSTPEKVPFQNP